MMNEPRDIPTLESMLAAAEEALAAEIGDLAKVLGSPDFRSEATREWIANRLRDIDYAEAWRDGLASELSIARGLEQRREVLP